MDADSGLVHTQLSTASHVHDIKESKILLHGKESMVLADAGYQGIEKRTNAKLKAGVRVKFEHLYQVVKRQFGHVKVRYRGLKRNTQQLISMFALSNLWMVRSKLMGARA